VCTVISLDRANLLLCAFVIPAIVLTRTFHIDDAVVQVALALIGRYLCALKHLQPSNNQSEARICRNVSGQFSENPDVTGRVKGDVCELGI